MTEDIENSPLPLLVAVARGMGMDAGILHSKEDLVDAILGIRELPENLMSVIRGDTNLLIKHHWETINSLMDPECRSCYLAGQSKCSDAVAISHYLVNRNIIAEIRSYR